MRNAVIVAAADCVMFLVALISGSVWAAVGVIALALAGLLLVVVDLRAQRREEQSEDVADSAPALAPENFAPDIADGDSEDVTGSAVGADEYGGDDFPFGEPLPSAEDPSEGRPRSPSSPGG